MIEIFKTIIPILTAILAGLISYYITKRNTKNAIKCNNYIL